MGYINNLIEEILQQIEVTGQEKEDFYQANLDQMNGQSYQDVQAAIAGYLLQQKQVNKIQGLIAELQEILTSQRIRSGLQITDLKTR